MRRDNLSVYDGTMPIDPKAVAERLRAVQTAYGLLRVADLAEALGAKRGQVSNWVNGYVAPPADYMATLVERAPELTLDWIYLGNAAGLPVKVAIKLQAVEEGVPLLSPGETEPAKARTRRKAGRHVRLELAEPAMTIRRRRSPAT